MSTLRILPRNQQPIHHHQLLPSRLLPVNRTPLHHPLLQQIRNGLERPHRHFFLSREARDFLIGDEEGFAIRKFDFGEGRGSVADCRDGFLGFVGGCDQFVGGGVFGEVEEESVATRIKNSIIQTPIHILQTLGALQPRRELRVGQELLGHVVGILAVAGNLPPLGRGEVVFDAFGGEDFDGVGEFGEVGAVGFAGEVAVVGGDYEDFGHGWERGLREWN
mmetsp:Transcript_12141/g.24522  ORF Transcript_12141/g.24522 Transcript_12141/m.24522 type:complete len:220 (+) Transcript_12141:204-863(+)